MPMPSVSKGVHCVNRQMPLQERGLHVHDALPDDELRKRIQTYPPLRWHALEVECATWASRHPAMTDDKDRQIFSFIVFMAATDKANKGGCYARNKIIAKKAGVSLRTVQRQLRRLKKLGAIEIKAQYGKKGQQTANLIKVPIDYSFGADDTLPHDTPMTKQAYPHDTPKTNDMGYTRTRQINYDSNTINYDVNERNVKRSTDCKTNADKGFIKPDARPGESWDAYKLRVKRARIQYRRNQSKNYPS